MNRTLSRASVAMVIALMLASGRSGIATNTSRDRYRAGTLQQTSTITQASCDEGDDCGSVSFDWADASPSECFGQQGQTLTITNTNTQKAIPVSVLTCQAFLNAEGDAKPCPTGVYGMQSAIGSTKTWHTGLCRTYLNAIGKYFLKYSISTKSSSGGGSTAGGSAQRRVCIPFAPHADRCAASTDAVDVGTYRLRVAAYSGDLNPSLNNPLFGAGDRRGKPLCVNVIGGNYTLGYCNDTPSERFYLGDRHPNHCTSLRQGGPGGLFTVIDPNEGGAKANLLGYGDADLVPNCAYEQWRVQWQLRPVAGGYEVSEIATGKCLQLDMSSRRDVNALPCRGTPEEVWTLDRVGQ